MEKRGQSSDALFILFSVFVIVLFFIAGIAFVNKASKDIDFSEKYIAIDTAFLLNTVYSSPSNLYITYYFGSDYRFTINTEDKAVLVKSNEINFGKKYFYIDNELIHLETKPLETSKLVYEKNESIIKVVNGALLKEKSDIGRGN